MSGKDIAAYFVKQGWSPAQAAGIASNVIAESSGKSGLTGDNGTAFGLAQWHKDRQANFKAWAGKDIHQATAAEQLAFIQYELTQGSEKGAGDQLKKALTGTEAGSIVSRAYERPKDVAGEASRRGAYAQSLLGIPGASAVAANAPQPGGASGTSIDRSVKTDIGTIQIQTQATDAPGIAQSGKISRFPFCKSSKLWIDGLKRCQQSHSRTFHLTLEFPPSAKRQYSSGCFFYVWSSSTTDFRCD